ncbi:TMEM165/GDT1 family protein [Geobacter pelophilus]|jgi:putative Ca2+/H+ antiporter (TMEM165/GDT1 family)|uniref:GDT1 family protein n=1 Tax=Geoanaerobacter pelophilus TaxID=60036 RepID=A0AAW4L0Q2_9BACT|nr:TMEM165/GDT1 family protein [Geoanaerobacter pelophilus]MBT0663722.1 TMEM165/GDT1 family protein [Geoanaerobacter pelophilus]
MESAIFFSTFGLIFLAELGDKTQLAAMALALRYPWQRIFVGIAAAFVVLNLAAVVVGKVLFLLLPIFWVTLVSGLLFLYFGYSTLRHACDSEDDDAGTPPTAATAARTAFIMIFMAELGDKTQLVTASQAAQHSGSLAGMSLVFAGSTLALWLVSLLGIFAGKQLVRFVPLCWIHRTAGAMFLLFGVMALWKLKGM